MMIEITYAYITIGVLFTLVAIFHQRDDLKDKSYINWCRVVIMILLSITLWLWIMPLYIYENRNDIKKWFKKQLGKSNNDSNNN